MPYPISPLVLPFFHLLSSVPGHLILQLMESFDVAVMQYVISRSMNLPLDGAGLGFFRRLRRYLCNILNLSITSIQNVDFVHHSLCSYHVLLSGVLLYGLSRHRPMMKSFTG